MRFIGKDLLNEKTGKKYKSYWVKRINQMNDKRSFLKNFFIEFIKFLMNRKKYWLMPIIIVLFMFGLLIVLSQGSAIAPFVYTLF